MSSPFLHGLAGQGRDRISFKCLCVEYGKFDTKLLGARPLLSTALPAIAASRAHTRMGARSPVPRELRDRRGAQLPSPRWRAWHGHSVASSFRAACLRTAPPCIIRKCAASEAAACSRAPLSLAERVHSTRARAPPLAPVFVLRTHVLQLATCDPSCSTVELGLCRLSLERLSPCASPTHLNEPCCERACLCCPRAARRRRATAPAHAHAP